MAHLNRSQIQELVLVLKYSKSRHLAGPLFVRFLLNWRGVGYFILKMFGEYWPGFSLKHISTSAHHRETYLQVPRLILRERLSRRNHRLLQTALMDVRPDVWTVL